MVTPEIISYIKTQLAAGYSPEALKASLSGQGWPAQDIQEAFSAASGSITANGNSNVVPAQSQAADAPVSTSAHLATKGGSLLIKSIIAIFAIGVIGSVGIGGFVVYGLFFNQGAFASVVCKVNSAMIWVAAGTKMPSSEYEGFKAMCPCVVTNMLAAAKSGKSPAEIAKGVFNIAFNQSVGSNLGKFACNANDIDLSSKSSPSGSVNANSSDPSLLNQNIPVDQTSLRFTGTASWLNDYSSLARLGDVSRIDQTIEDRNGAAIATSTFSVENGMVIDHSGKDVTSYMRELVAIGTSTLSGLQLSVGSTDWNADGKWYPWDHYASSTSQDDLKYDPSTMIRVIKENDGIGEDLLFETRTITDNKFDIEIVRIFRGSNLTKSLESLSFNYSGKDFMTAKSISQISAMYPKSDYYHYEYSYASR